MARRYETITELYRKTVAGLAAPQAWQSFLTTACHNFRLPFDEQVLLYAQRPDATAVLPIEGKNGWNQRFGRWVNRGATGIAVFDGDAVGRSRLKYYFDISDTHESRFARPMPIWTMRPEYEPAVMEALENSFGELEDKTDLAAALLSAAKNAAQDNMPDYLTELKYYKENSFWELIDKKEYFINTKITPPKSYDSQQLSLFDFADFQAPGREESGQLSFMPRPQLSQQVIDEALCTGANDRNSRLIICAYFMKDHTPEENAAFLAKHYGTNGAGFYINERKYSIWYGDEGIRISDGESAQRRYATLLTWEQAARRIRELLDLGRYMPQSELDRTVEYERKTISESLALTARDFSEEAREAGYAPTLRLALSAKGGFPEIEQQISELLKDPDMLQRITEEWGEFVAAHEQNRNLMRFGYNRPKELLQKLTDLGREPITFTAAEDYNPQRRFFISMDEIDKVLRGGGEDYRLAVYSFFVNHSDQKDREKYLKNYHGEYSGYHGGNDNRTYTSKGLSFSHGDLTQPYAKVELKWSVIVKRIDVLMSQDRFLSDQDREAMAGYEIRQLARSIHSFFIDAPELYPRPYQANAIADYWEGVEEVAEQLTDPNRVEEIYQMMLPLWEGIPQDDRHYQSRKTGLENMQAYRAGTYSVFNRAQTLRPLSSGAETPSAEPETPKPELPVTPAEEEQNHVSQNEELEEAKLLINEYCLEVFDQEADFSDLSHVDLAFSSTSDSEHTVEIFADLAAFRLVYQVDSETVHEIACKNLSELNGYLANLDFDEMVAHADERYQQEHADRGELAEHEPEPKEPAEKEQSTILAPPKSKRERVVFTTLHPEIPADQRRNFRITDSELGYGTRSEKYAANVAAIRCLKEIEAEERLATPEEQEILSRYVGWGGLADCFDERHGKYLELKSLLDEDEYAAARASSLTAFYTSPVIIGAMYQALSQMGFRQGNILEPSCGVGNFICMLPDSMADSKAYGVEIDSISGRIAQQLYQNSSIAVNGFEKVQMPDSFFDVAIGNVPFGDFKVRDKKYDKNHWLIHDYFFGKTLDKVRPGGVIAFITSKGTMDKENSAVRKYLAQRADLIGAIRLPNNAFKANAGTEVTSDIIFLQKRDRMTDIEPDWVHLDTDENGIRMNRYFVQHPKMILGDMVMESTRFGMTMKGTLSHTAILGADVFGNLTRMDNVIDGLSSKLEAVRAELADTQVQLENARTELAAPFAREAELDEKTARLKELNILLNMDQKDKSLIDDVPDEDTPERPRSKGMER